MDGRRRHFEIRKKYVTDRDFVGIASWDWLSISGRTTARARKVWGPTSGANSGIAVGLGDIMRNGFELAVMQKNADGGLLGHPIEVIHYDEGYSADESVASARKAIADGVAGIAGGNDATTCVAMKDVAAEVSMPLVVTACGSELITEEGYEGAVHVRAPVKQSQSDSNALSVLARWMIQQGYQRVQGVGADSDWVRLTDEEFSRIFAAEAPAAWKHRGILLPVRDCRGRLEVTRCRQRSLTSCILGLWGKECCW